MDSERELKKAQIYKAKQNIVYEALKKNIELVKQAEEENDHTLCLKDENACKSYYLNTLKDYIQTEENSFSEISEYELSTVNVYLGNILIYILFRDQYYQQAYETTLYILNNYKDIHTHTMNILLARTVGIYSIIAKKVENGFNREYVFSLYRNACLFNNIIGQASLYNLILSMYIYNKEYEAAATFIQRSHFPADISDKQYVRYLYYKGLIECVQLEYTHSSESLQQALRYIDGKQYLGIQTKIHQIYILVQLLMGDIPDRNIFNIYINTPYLSLLSPYYYLTQIVRTGDVHGFSSLFNKYSDIFKHDGTYHLILRLRSNVLRLAIRQIYISYSRISIEEVANRLGITAEDAEFICARTIRDGVIDAELDHENGYLTSKDQSTIQITESPRIGFQKRIETLLNIKHEVLRAKQ
ncbi:hypothetical protein WA158_006080 [Blastocystis sp. Blastoise]